MLTSRSSSEPEPIVSRPQPIVDSWVKWIPLSITSWDRFAKSALVGHQEARSLGDGNLTDPLLYPPHSETHTRFVRRRTAVCEVAFFIPDRLWSTGRVSHPSLGAWRWQNRNCQFRTLCISARSPLCSSICPFRRSPLIGAFGFLACSCSRSRSPYPPRTS